MIDEYEAAWSVRDLFAVNGSPAPGVVTTHDQFAISWTKDESTSKVERLLATASEAEARAIWRLCSQDQWLYSRAKRELGKGTWRQHVVGVLYRPFDSRYTVFDRNVAVHRRERVMRHMLAGKNVALITCRQQAGNNEWSLCGITDSIIESSAISNRTKEINYLFPLYLYPQKDDGVMDVGAAERRVNLAPEFVLALEDATGLTFMPDGRGDRTSTFGPEDALAYVYAILHSPAYRLRYANFLKSDFPRIPLPSDAALFRELAAVGDALVGAHLQMDAPAADRPAFPVAGNGSVVLVRYTEPAGDHPGRV